MLHQNPWHWDSVLLCSASSWISLHYCPSFLDLHKLFTCILGHRCKQPIITGLNQRCSTTVAALASSCMPIDSLDEAIAREGSFSGKGDWMPLQPVDWTERSETLVCHSARSATWNKGIRYGEFLVMKAGNRVRHKISLKELSRF